MAPEASETTAVDVPGRGVRVASYLLSALPAALLAMSGGMKLARAPQVLEQMSTHFGWPASVVVTIGLVELASTLLYLVPRTAILGAVLLTGYLGGAIATHVRIGEGFVAPLLMGIVIWGGLWLREPRLKALLPLR